LKQESMIEDIVEGTDHLRVSVIIVTYFSERYIEKCLESVFSNDPDEVIVVDNASKDGTLEKIRNRFGSVRLIARDDNIGYGAAVNLAVRESSGDAVVVLNPDTIVCDGWLRKLTGTLRSVQRVIAVPRIMIYDGSVVNTCGNQEHFTGLTFTNGLGLHPDMIPDELNVSGISGACFAMRRDDFLHLGGFDEALFLYMEDAELSWRAHAHGYSFVYVHDSIVRHDYKLNVNAEKLFRLENGRYYLLRKFLTTKDMFSIGPSLIMSEALSWGFAVRLGAIGIRYKMRSMMYFFSNPREVQQSDYKKFLSNFENRIPDNQLSYGFVDKMAKKWANLIFVANFRILTR
jgi:GT2 family glycosyltransferase